MPARTERSRHQRKREDAVALTALAISAALHAALVAWVQHRQSRRRAPSRIPIELVVREVRRERANASPAAERQGSEAPSRPRGSAPARSRAGPRVATPVPDRGTAAWFEAEGLERQAPALPAPGALRPRPPKELAPRAEEGETPAPGDGAAEARRRVQETLGEIMAAERARTPDRELGEMRAALADGFEAPWSAVEGGGGTALSSELAHVARGYMRTADEYGRSGRVSGGTYAREIVALVRVNKREDGAIEIAIEASSGHRAYDALALARVRGARAGGVVAAAMGKHPKTVWAFITRFEIVPPVPAVGCGLDALFHLDPGRCVYPLKKLPPASRVELRGTE